MFDPVSSIVDKLPKFRLDVIVRDAEIALGRAVISGPPPNAIKHSAVETSQESFVEDSPLAGESPEVSFGDVLLFEFVEFAAQRDMCRDQRVAFLGRQGRRIVVGIEQIS